MYQFVRTLNDRQALLSKDNEYFIASFADVYGSGPEVLVFPATEDGRVSDSGEVDGGRGYRSLQDFLNKHLG